MFCKICGKKLPDNAAFCTNCGRAITQSQTPDTSFTIHMSEQPITEGRDISAATAISSVEPTGTRKIKKPLFIVLAAVGLVLIGFLAFFLLKLRPVPFEDETFALYVKHQLGKSATDTVSYLDAESLTSLRIDDTYSDPVFDLASINYRNLVLEISLNDLQFLPNLRELDIDNYIFDQIYDLDAIRYCKKLERLHINYNLCEYAYNTMPYGYRTMESIVAELPALETLDLGIYISEYFMDRLEHAAASDTLTIKSSDNYMTLSAIAFCNNRGYHEPLREQYINDPDEISASKVVYFISPDSEEDYEEMIDNMNPDTEYVHIYARGASEYDISPLKKLEKLTCLSFLNPVNPISHKIYYTNLTGLDKLPALKSITLAGCNIDKSLQSTLAQCTKLHLITCALDDAASLSAMSELKSLTLMYNTYSDSFDENMSKHFSDMTSLRYLSIYESQSDYTDCKFESLPKLYSLHLYAIKSPSLFDSLADCPSLGYLMYDLVTRGNTINMRSLQNIDTLKYINIYGLQNYSDLDSISQLSKLQALLITLHEDTITDTTAIDECISRALKLPDLSILSMLGIYSYQINPINISGEFSGVNSVLYKYTEYDALLDAGIHDIFLCRKRDIEQNLEEFERIIGNLE